MDTSSLFKFFKEPNLRAALLSWLKTQDRRLIVSPLTVEEMLDHHDEELVISQLDILSKLWRTLQPNHFAWIKMPYDLFTFEVTNSLVTSLTISKDEKVIYRRHLKDKKAITLFVKSPRENGQTGAYAHKEKLKSLDDKFNAEAQRRSQAKDPAFNHTQIKESILSYKGPTKDSFLFEPILAYLKEKNDVALTSNEVIQNPKKHLYLYTWICLAEMTAWGNTLSKDDSSDEAKGLRGGHGNWYDNGIAASAARSDLFICQDKGLIWKCNHLNKLGFLNFKTKNIETMFG